jgi:hypothetical protein
MQHARFKSLGCCLTKVSVPKNIIIIIIVLFSRQGAETPAAGILEFGPAGCPLLQLDE